MFEGTAAAIHGPLAAGCFVVVAAKRVLGAPKETAGESDLELSKRQTGRPPAYLTDGLKSRGFYPRKLGVKRFGG